MLSRFLVKKRRKSSVFHSGAQSTKKCNPAENQQESGNTWLHSSSREIHTVLFTTTCNLVPAVKYWQASSCLCPCWLMFRKTRYVSQNEFVFRLHHLKFLTLLPLLKGINKKYYRIFLNFLFWTFPITFWV